MDEIDRKILKTYQANPALPIAELSNRVFMSHTACWKRLKRLEREGYIVGRAVILDQQALGLNVTVIVRISIELHTAEILDEFEKSILNIPEIVTCYSMSGDSDYILRVITGSIEEYEKFLKEKLAKLPHIKSVKSSFALKPVKNTTQLPI